MITGKILALFASLLSRIGVPGLLSWVIGMGIIFSSLLILGAASTYIVPGYETEITLIIIGIYFVDIIIGWITQSKDN